MQINFEILKCRIQMKPKNAVFIANNRQNNFKRNLENAFMSKKSNNKAENHKKIDRANLLEVSSWLVESLHIRLNVERFKEREGDSTRLQYVRALIQAVQTHNTVLKDTEIEDLKHRLDQLEASQEFAQ